MHSGIIVGRAEKGTKTQRNPSKSKKTRVSCNIIPIKSSKTSSFLIQAKTSHKAQTQPDSPQEEMWRVWRNARVAESPDRKRRLSYAQCYGCSREVPTLPQLRHSKEREVFFCNRKCFNLYLSKNRPILPNVFNPALGVSDRLQLRINELMAENLYSLIDHSFHVREELIYELQFILEGKYQVTKGDRLPKEPEPMVIQVKE